MPQRKHFYKRGEKGSWCPRKASKRAALLSSRPTSSRPGPTRATYVLAAVTNPMAHASVGMLSPRATKVTATRLMAAPNEDADKHELLWRHRRRGQGDATTRHACCM